MDLKEICKKEVHSVTETEAKYLVQSYIFERTKGKDVIIDLDKPSNPLDMFNPRFRYEQEHLLMEAFKIAKDWFNENKFK